MPKIAKMAILIDFGQKQPKNGQNTAFFVFFVIFGPIFRAKMENPKFNEKKKS